MADKPALSLMLGHADNSMAAEYRERIKTDQLEVIGDDILRWLSSADTVRSMSAH